MGLLSARAERQIHGSEKTILVAGMCDGMGIVPLVLTARTSFAAFIKEVKMSKKAIYLDERERELISIFMQHSIAELEGPQLCETVLKKAALYTRKEMINLLARIQP